ncbi:unnamed protein product [Alopecurus aequalis]
MAAGEIPGLTAGFKFEPDDEEVIGIFLLPRLRGEPLPLEGVVIDDEPLSAPPWKLFSRNGRDKANSAYFFAPGDAANSRKVRSCAGVGTWVWQNREETGKLRIGDEIFAWEKVRFNFHLGSRRSGSTGWVMLEYSVDGPGDCASFKVCHISFTGHGQKRKRVPDDNEDDSADVTRHQLQVAATSSSTATGYQDPTGDRQDQEHFLMQAQDAGVDGVTTGPWIHQHQEPFGATMQQHHGQKRRRVSDAYDDNAVTHPQLEVAATSSTALQPLVYNGAGVDGVTGPWINQQQEPFATTTQQQFVDHEQPPLDYLCSFNVPAMDHGMMPLHADKETCVPEQFADYGTMPPPMDQDSGMPPEQSFFGDDDPAMRQVLESLGDFATAAQADAAFGDHWASAGHHVLPEHSHS